MRIFASSFLRTFTICTNRSRTEIYPLKNPTCTAGASSLPRLSSSSLSLLSPSASASPCAAVVVVVVGEEEEEEEVVVVGEAEEENIDSTPFVMSPN